MSDRVEEDDELVEAFDELEQQTRALGDLLLRLAIKHDRPEILDDVPPRGHA
jgi:hypothetical protein